MMPGIAPRQLDYPDLWAQPTAAK